MRARSILGVLVLLAAACGDSGDSTVVPELRGDGLGVVDFGDDAQTVMATLTELLGPPFADSGWEHTGEELSGFGPACLGK
ncbi:MAG: hypothetical protein GY953_37500 [bacterium]|nr:hypothetical protein [bacterium]